MYDKLNKTKEHFGVFLVNLKFWILDIIKIYHCKMTYGYVYCFSNESMPGILKVGETDRLPDVRLKEANRSDTWRPPTPYKIEFAKKVLKPKEKEKKLHLILSEHRINPNREFFRISSKKLHLLFDLMDGENWEIEKIEKSTDTSIERHSVSISQNDYIGQWFQECTVAEPNETCPFSELYSSYQTWLDKVYGNNIRVDISALKERLVKWQRDKYGFSDGINGTITNPKINIQVKDED